MIIVRWRIVEFGPGEAAVFGHFFELKCQLLFLWPGKFLT